MLWGLQSSISIQTALLTLSVLTSFLPSGYAFSFSYTAPTQCGDLTVRWDGGTGPFRLQITPPFSTPLYYPIPDSSFSNGKGSFTLRLALNASDTFLMTMSDSTGFGSGGTSDLLTVGGSPTNTTCDLTEKRVDFIFITDNALVQCRPYIFNGYPQAQGAITITGLIPLGNTFVLKPPPGSTSFSWTANVKSGTRIIFFMTDSAGRQGGATDLLFVGASDGTSCLSADSPASTAQSQTLVPTGTSTGGPRPTNTGSGGSSSNGGVIGGAIAGGLVAIIIVVSLVWFVMRRRRQKNDTPHVSAHFSKRRSGAIDLLPEDGHYPLPRGGQDGNNNYEPIPYVLPDSHSSEHMSASGLPPSRGPGTAYSASTAGDYPPGHPGYGWNNTRTSTATDLNPQGYAISSSQGRSSKHALAFSNSGGQPPNTPARFVLHTDAGEVQDAPNEEEEEEEVVELPPQYSSLTPAQRKASQRQAQGRPGGSGQAGPSS